MLLLRVGFSLPVPVSLALELQLEVALQACHHHYYHSTALLVEVSRSTRLPAGAWLGIGARLSSPLAPPGRAAGGPKTAAVPRPSADTEMSPPAARRGPSTCRCCMTAKALSADPTEADASVSSGGLPRNAADATPPRAPVGEPSADARGRRRLGTKRSCAQSRYCGSPSKRRAKIRPRR